MTLKHLAWLAALLLSSTASAQTLYVTNQQDGVAVLDGATLARQADIDIGGHGPRGIAVTHDGSLLVTANQATGDLSVMDRASGKPLARIPIGPSAEMVRVLGHTAFVTYEPPGKKGEDTPAHIAIVDLDQRQVTASVESGHETEGLEFSADGKMLLVTNEGDDSVSVYSLPGGAFLRKVDTKSYGTRPRGIKRLPGGDGYIVSLEFSDHFLVLDKDLKVVKSVPTAAGPYGLAFSPDGGKLFVAAAKAGLIQEFDAKTYEHIADVAVGKRCWHFTFAQNGSKIVAACGRSNALFVVDTAAMRALPPIEGFKLPWGIVAYPNVAGTLDAP
jgi:YVTN family beta-propeller protein